MPVNDSTITTLQVDNAEFLPHVKALINEGHSITLPLRGYSMRPFLKDGRDKALLAAPENISVDDVVLAEVREGVYVLHRIVAISGKQITLLGDGNITPEHCLAENICAKAIGFYRKGRTMPDSTNGMKWKLYSALWKRLRPVRRYLLFILNPHIPNRFKRK